jgi:hypothetical protein
MRCGPTLYLLKQEMVHWSYEFRHCTPDGGRSLVELCVDLYRSGKWSQDTFVDVQDLVCSYFCVYFFGITSTVPTYIFIYLLKS